MTGLLMFLARTRPDVTAGFGYFGVELTLFQFVVFRLLIEVSLDEDGRKLLTAVVQPFTGMLWGRIPAGQRTAAFSTAAPPVDAGAVHVTPR